MSTLRFEFVAQDRMLYNGDVNMVVIPGAGGVIGVLPKHAPLLAAVAPGEVVIRIEGEEDQYFAVGGGFVEVRPDKVVLVAPSGERASEIDAVRAEAALKRAQEYLANPEAHQDMDTRVAMEAALRRSQVRLNIARRRSGIRSSERPTFSSSE